MKRPTQLVLILYYIDKLMMQKYSTVVRLGDTKRNLRIKISVLNVIMNLMPYLIAVAYFSIFIMTVWLIWFAVNQCAYWDYSSLLPWIHLHKYIARSVWAITIPIEYVFVGTSDGQWTTPQSQVDEDRPHPGFREDLLALLRQMNTVCGQVR